MKILVKDGKVSAEAETMADIIALQNLSTKSVGRKLEPSWSPVLPKKGKRGGNTWKGKHKIPCSECDGSYKNLKLHILRTHSGHSTWSKKGTPVTINKI